MAGLKTLLLWAGIIIMVNYAPVDSRTTTYQKWTSPPFTMNWTSTPIIMITVTPTVTQATTAPPPSTPPSNTTSNQIDSQANTTQNQTSPTTTMPNTTVTPTIKDTTQAPPPPQCSYNVTPIDSGFKIDVMINSTPGNYIIYITDKGRKESTAQSFSGTSHEIRHLKPCTEYEHRVAYRDNAGNETPCNSTESKIMTTGMSSGAITEVSCMPGYVCYQSDWNISSSLSTSNNIPPEPCQRNNRAFCIKPEYKDICTDLTTTFTSGDCANSFNLTKSITVADFLDPRDITQTAPTGLPAKIKPELPERCTSLTIDYTCQDELGNIKNESELEPFTNYTCTGQIKNNNVPINQTTPLNFSIDCDLTIKPELSATSTTIDLTWTTNSMKCPVLPRLGNLSYDCSCAPPSKHKASVPADKTQTGGMCRFTGLDPYTDYECTVQPNYNKKEVASPPPVIKKTEAAKPEGIPDVNWTLTEHNVVRVICKYEKQSNGPDKKYSARLYYNGELQETLKVPDCIFEFKDLSYLTEYTVKVSVFNGKYDSNPTTITVTTSYNDKALIGCLLTIIIIVIIITPVVVFKIYILWCKNSRNDVNDDMMLEPTALYVNVPQYGNRR